MASSHAKPFSISDTAPVQSSTAESAQVHRKRCCKPYASSSSSTPAMLPMTCDVSITVSGSTVSTSRRRALLTGIAFENNSTTPPVKVQPATTVRTPAPARAAQTPNILAGPRERPGARQCLHCAEQRACANQRDKLVHHPKREEPGEDLVGRKASGETHHNDCIEHAEAAGDMTDQPGHESQNVHCQNVWIPDGRGMR